MKMKKKNEEKAPVEYGRGIVTDPFFDFEGPLDEKFLCLWDRYGFFAHVYWEAWEEQVMKALPDNASRAEILEVVNRFMERHQKLYCCMN
jgi:hypothetical protein